MRYIIAASVSTDDVYQSDGTFYEHVMGGAGFYALCGVRLYTEDVVITGGVGPSYFKMHNDWYVRNRIHTEGLVVRCEDAVTTVDYRKEDDRTDTPSIGLWEFRKRDPNIEEVSRFFDFGTKGIYTFRHYDEVFLNEIKYLKTIHDFSFMWEISEDACSMENRKGIEDALSFVDIFSINRHELCLLYGVEDEEEAISHLMKRLKHIAYVRRGKDGAVVLDGKNETISYVSPCLSRKIVDTTGCGNASSGAFLYGIGEGYSLKKAASLASVAASYVLSQFGPPQTFNKTITAEAEKEACELYKEK